VIVPSHCTGGKAVHSIARRFPDAYIQNSVGTTFSSPRTRPNPRFAGGKLDVDAFGFDGHQDDDAEGFATVKLKGGR
jgi:hypothetical protein